MKKIKYFIFGLFLFLFSCKNDSGMYSGYINAKKNGVDWSAEIYALSNKPNDIGMDLVIYHHNSQGFIRDNLGFFKIPISEGEYNIDSTGVRDIDELVGAILFRHFDDGDVVSSVYDLIEDGSEINKITINKIDGDIIRGTFDVSFVKNSTNPFGANDPDTVIFSDGVFETKLVEQ